ncbi:hypothetical protein [Kribbella sp. NPDC023855]|uniref:COG4315 family predicted lipoprotein n=1 Tax=Kribbella sp. NPDC023855 TaxID=3154698 RepID=UPI00340FF558
MHVLQTNMKPLMTRGSSVTTARTVLAAVLTAAIGLGLTACDGSGSDGTGASRTDRPTVSDHATRQEPPETVPPLKAAPARLALRRQAFIPVKTSIVNIPGGSFEILTANGKAVYRFERDANEPSRVNCVDDCPITWPPVVVDDAKVTLTAGIDAKLVGTVQRADGHRQLTYSGWPLYWFIEDATKGDARGEGFGDSWSAIGRSGDAVFAKPRLR